MNLFNYKRLFSVKYIHDYYSNGFSNDFTIKATEKTAETLQKSGLILRQVNNGFEIHADSRKIGDQYKTLKEIDVNSKLVFLLELNNPYFINFTDLPFNNSIKSLFYFNNVETSEHNENIHLSTSEYVGKEQGVEYHYDYFFKEIISDINIAFGEIIFPDDNTSFQQKRFKVLEKNTDTEGKFLYSFVLQNKPAGRFNFLFNKKKQNEVFYYNITSFKSFKIFGIIEIFLDNSVLPDARFINEQNVISEKEYFIKFKNRSTYWRYIVDNKSKQDLQDPGIVHTKLDLNFDKDSALNFTSQDVIPLSSDPIQGLEFRKNKNAAGSKIKSNLPNPGIDMIRIDTDNENKIYSDIYVTI